MGLLNISPTNAKMLRDVSAIAIVGFFFVMGMAYMFTSLQDVLTFGLIP